MDVIDIHAHMWTAEWFSESWWNGVGCTGEALGLDPDRAIRSYKKLSDPTGEHLLDAVTAAGVSFAAMLPMDFTFQPGHDPNSILDQQDAHFTAAENSAGRLITFAGVDPRREDALELLTLAADRGARGLKLYPPMGFVPTDKCVEPLYQFCSERQLPVLFHTGPSVPTLHSNNAHPSHLDDVARQFPQLRVIQGHCGHEWWESALAVAKHHPHVYVDVCCWQARYHRNPKRFYQIFRDMLDIAGPRKVLFASDFPAFEKLVDYGRWVDVFRSPDPQTLDAAGVSFTEDELALVLAGNARRVLGLS
jgi:predicted TIM-barrel fold metal-dependent hydrolase